MARHLGLAFMLLVAAAAPAQPQPAPSADQAQPRALAELVAEARAARLRGDVNTWLELGSRALALAPGHPDLLVSVARANAAAGDKENALRLLSEAVRRGAGFDAARFPELRVLADDPRFVESAKRGLGNQASTGKAKSVARLPDQEPEGIAYDPMSRRFFTGTSDGRLLSIDRSGRVSEFISGGGLRQILGIKVDRRRRLLWLVSGRYPEGQNDPPDAGTAEIRAYHLGSRKLVRKLELNELPTQHGLNDLALASDGTVFVTDTAAHSVYRAAPGANRLELLIRDSSMTFPNGIALSADERTLYVAHVEGISAIDPRSARRSLLAVPEDASVHSIDGLLLHQGKLFGVQNSPYLNRLVAIRLAPDGQTIDKVWAISAHDPPDRLKTTAADADGAVFIVGGAPLPDIYGGQNPATPEFHLWRVELD